MAYDRDLAARVDELLADEPGYVSKRMFSGLGMMLGDHMAVGVISSGLLVRVPKGTADEVLAEPGTRPFVMREAPSKSWVVVVPEAVEDDDSLREWVARGVQVARSLPPKHG